jgi:hypothetical protein
MPLDFYLELSLCFLLMLTLVYCIVLERRLNSVRKGQDGLKSTMADLNGTIAAAGASLRALKQAAAEAGMQLDGRLTKAATLNEELHLITASADRIAQRLERAADPRAHMRAAEPRANEVHDQLPSGSIMNRVRNTR